MPIRALLTRYFARKFYPTTKIDWYRSKGYIGQDDEEIFEHFVSVQKDIELKRIGANKFYDAFDGLDLKRIKIKSGKDLLDGVFVQVLASNIVKSSTINCTSTITVIQSDKVIIMFQGRLEHYESRFRDMCELAKSTGAKILGFNPKGFRSSSGMTLTLEDLTDDGVAVVEYLLDRGFLASNIIMLGNSLGAAVQELVCRRLYKERQLSGFRQINSNSFNSLSSVIAYKLGLPILEKLLQKIFAYAGWEFKVDIGYYTTGPMRLCLSRLGDRTILPPASYYIKVNKDRDRKCIGFNNPYIKDYDFLSHHNLLALRASANQTNQDPHILSLNQFVSASDREYTAFDIISYYLNASDRFIVKMN